MKAPAYHITGHVPVLDSSLEFVGELGVVGDISNSEDVLFSLDSQVLIDSDTSILFEREAGFLEETSCGRDTGTHDNEASGEGVLTLEVDSARLGRIGF
jgi:hypothetical protein